MIHNSTMKVDSVDECPYVVVQFLQLPYADIGDYTCVPHSWIRSRRATDRKSMVAYPDEPPSITKMRIMNGNEPSEKWKVYMAIIKLETKSYKDAYEFIMEKSLTVSKNRYLAVMSTDNKLVPATATKRYSPLLKRTNLLDPQSKKNKNKLKVVNKARLGDTIPNSGKPSKHPNVESKIPASPELPVYDSLENIMMNETDRREYQERMTHEVRLRSDDFLRRYYHTQRIPENGNGNRVNSPGAGSKIITQETLHASRDPLIFINQICYDSQQPQENQLLSIYHDHLHHIALTHGIQNKGIPNLRTFLLNIPEPLTWNSNTNEVFDSNTSFVIQNPITEANQSRQLESPKSSPVNKDRPQVYSTQKTPGQSSELQCTNSKPSFHSAITNASYVSVGGSNSAEHEDSSIEKMVVDEPSEVNCVGQNVLSEHRAENEFSDFPNFLGNTNYSGQSAVRSMEEMPMNDEVRSNDVSSTQDVGDDELRNSPEISSKEILTGSPNPNEQIDQSVDSVLNRADVLVDQIIDLFQKMKVNYSHTCEIVHDLHKSLVKSHGVIERIVNTFKNLRELKKSNITIVTSKKVIPKVQQMAQEDKADRKEDKYPDVNKEEDKKDENIEESKRGENDDDVVVDDRVIKDDKDKNRDEEAVKKTRDHIRSFVLPPEYDPDDTRWTLKYREHDPELNLVELIPQRNVFINSIKLAHCKRVSKNSKTLARMLLVEIFSQNALSVCSYTGARANAFDISGTNVRPGLDKPARMAILSFVEKHALEKKWGAFDSQSIINSLRSKIHEVRAKHGKTV